jgi:hypothetical protein
MFLEFVGRWILHERIPEMMMSARGEVEVGK